MGGAYVRQCHGVARAAVSQYAQGTEIRAAEERAKPQGAGPRVRPLGVLAAFTRLVGPAIPRRSAAQSRRGCAAPPGPLPCPPNLARARRHFLATPFRENSAAD